MISMTRLVLAMHYSNLQQQHTKIKLNISTATCLEFYRVIEKDGRDFKPL